MSIKGLERGMAAAQYEWEEIIMEARIGFFSFLYAGRFLEGFYGNYMVEAKYMADTILG